MSDHQPEFFLYHETGPSLRATFSSANDAYIWQKGNADQPWASMFYFENDKGERVTFEDQKYHPGHAYALLDAALSEEGR